MAFASSLLAWLRVEGRGKGEADGEDELEERQSHTAPSSEASCPNLSGRTEAAELGPLLVQVSPAGS